MRYVTSFGPEGYKQYGAKFLLGWLEHGNPNDELLVYLEEPDNGDLPAIQYRNLFEVDGVREFLGITGAVPAFQGKVMTPNGLKRDYRFDIHKFCRKTFAQVDAATDYSGRLVWLDADVEFKGDIDLPEHQGEFMQYLGRSGGHSCASYVSWDCSHPQSAQFWQTYYMAHMSGDVFKLPEWHDSFVLDVIRESMKLDARNVAPPVAWPGNVFDEAFPWGHHKKGNLKKAA